MVMRGGGRNREIQRLQAAQQGGQATARQQQRLEYLQDNRGAGRRPQGPQTGGPLQEAMAPGGQDAIRTQQPYQGGQMSNGGTTWDGQAPINPYGGKQPTWNDPGFPGGQPKDSFRGFGNQAELDAYRKQRGEQMQSGELNLQPDQLPQSMRDMLGQSKFSQDPNSQNGYRPGGGVNPVPPMQRPTPGNIDPGFQKQLPPGALNKYQPGPNYFHGEGMGADRFSKFGSPPPQQQPVQGDYFRGGGMDNSRFARPGTQPAFQPPVQGNQIRGGGFGPRTQRVNRNRGSQPAGVLAPIPR